MGAIPLPALDIKPPATASALDSFARVTQIKSLLQGQQLQQQHIEEGDQALQDDEKMRSAWQSSGGDPDLYIKNLGKNGLSAKTIIGQSQALLELKKKAADLDELTLKNAAVSGDQYRGRLLSIVSGPESAKQSSWEREVANEEAAGTIQPGTLSKEYPGDHMVTSLANHLMLGSAIAKEALENRNADTAAQSSDTQRQRLQAELPKIQADATIAQQQAQLTPEQRAMQGNLPYQAAGGSPQAQTAMRLDQQGKINVAGAEARARAAATAPTADSDADIVKGMLDGTVDITKVASIRGNRREQLVAQAMRQDSNFNMANYPQRLRVQEKFSSGKGADQISSLNTFAGHVADASDLVDGLRNTRSPLINAPVNKVAAALGNDKIAPFSAALEAAKDEYLNFLKGGHAPQQQELQLADKLVNPNQSPAQLQAVLKQMTNTILIRAGSLNAEYARTMHKDYPMLTPEAVQALGKLGYGDRAAKFAGGGPMAGGGSSPSSAAAIGPNGHRIKVVNGQWVDAQSGAPIQ